MPAPEDILKKYWGYNSFRPMQREIIDSILSGRDTLALLPTGGGKSLCYQVPALMMDGFCLVISPLIALMHDQVARLKELGIDAAFIDAGMRYADVKRTMENMLHGPYKLLYASPERLQTELFKEYLPLFDINLIAVDEAHCISQWGYDFRPDYLKINSLRSVFKATPIIALTASATKRVQEDVVEKLQLSAANIFKTSFSRPNINYAIKYSENKLTDMLASLNGVGSSLVYCRSRKQAEAVAKNLIQRNISAVAYHAGMHQSKREENQQAWMTGRIPIMAATTAFGMGIDKADVRTVVHYDTPECLEAYYQEAGRAGRDGKAANAILLYNSTDIKKLRNSTAVQYPPEAYLRQVYQSVVEYLQIPISAQPDRYYPFDLPEFCKRFDLKPLEATYALKILEQEDLWTISEAVFQPATILFTADRNVLDQLQQTYPDLYYVTTGLLRLYGTAFQFPTVIRIGAIAKQLRLKQEQVEQLLQQLHRMELLEYNKPGEGPQLFFHHYRVNNRDLIIDLQRIHNLRQQHEVRTEAMIRFLENETECRERMLLQYFGESINADCGHCDICHNKQSVITLNAKTLRNEIWQRLSEHNNISIQLLTGHYPPAVKEKAIMLIRQMADEGLVRIEGDKIRINK